MKITHGLLGLFMILSTSTVYAQNSDSIKNDLLSNIDKMSGIYYSYTPDTTPKTPAPKGYKPFYISTYNRHGIRWNSSSSDYERPLLILEEASQHHALTPKGQELLRRVRIICNDAKDRHGDLMPMGESEHRGIAQRMFDSYPNVFKCKKKASLIRSYSTPVPRCMLSMTAFNDQLKGLNPHIQFTYEVSKRNQYFMCNTSGADRIDEKDKQPLLNEYSRQILHPERFFRTIFSDTSYLNNYQQTLLMCNIFTMACTLKGRPELHLNLHEYFTTDEMFSIWQQSNHWLYLSHGPSAQFADTIEHDARFLVNHIINCADSAIALNNCIADLRFGHDFGIIPLIAAMKIEGGCTRVSQADEVWKVWQNYRLSPMAANVQLIFYKHSTNRDILIKILVNETEVKLDMKDAPGPYYKWDDVKNFWRNYKNKPF